MRVEKPLEISWMYLYTEGGCELLLGRLREEFILEMVNTAKFLEPWKFNIFFF